jgi:hypothetical protein
VRTYSETRRILNHVVHRPQRLEQLRVVRRSFGVLQQQVPVQVVEIGVNLSHALHFAEYACVLMTWRRVPTPHN